MYVIAGYSHCYNYVYHTHTLRWLIQVVLNKTCVISEFNGHFYVE